MSVLEYSSSINSCGSRFENSEEGIEVTKIKNYVKDLLKSKIFLGRYLERRLINERVGYRDIVLLSPAELDFKRDLNEACQNLRSVYPNRWIGISDSETLGFRSSGVIISTEIDNQPFGAFWFQVRSIKFRDEEIMLTVKCLRHISESFIEIEPILTGSEKKTKDVSQCNPVNAAATLGETYKEIATNLKAALTISNVKDFVTFLAALVIAVFTGSTAFVNFIGNFVLALLREMSFLIKNSTPMFLGFLDFLSKIVGGFYILLAMIFRTNSPPPVNRRTLAHYEPQRQHKQQYDDRSFD